MTTILEKQQQLCYPNLHNTKIFLVAAFILSIFNYMIYTTNDFLKYRMMEQQQKEQEASYRIEKNGPCQCVQTFDEQISDRVIKSTMCSRESAMSGKFHRKVISYAYYENHAHDNIDYFYQTKKNLIAIKQNYGQGWSMRLYIALSKISSNKRKYLCDLSCKYPEEFEFCDVENNPRYGNLSNIVPENWPFLTMLDSQVELAFSRHLGSIHFQQEMRTVKQFLKSANLYLLMQDLRGVKLTPYSRARIYEKLKTLINSHSDNFITHIWHYWTKHNNWWHFSYIIIFLLLIFGCIIFRSCYRRNTTIKKDIWHILKTRCLTFMKNNKVFVVIVFILFALNIMLYHLKNENLLNNFRIPTYEMEPMGPCKYIHTSDNQIIDQVIKSTMCSAESAMSGKFNRKAISYSYHEYDEYDDPSKDVYFNGIKKNLFAIKEHFGQGWSMRLYIAWSKFSSNKRKNLCNLACEYPEEFEICDVENNPRYGDLSTIMPMSWRFLTMLDPQVDVAFACDLRQSKIIPITFEHKMKSIKKILRSPRTLQFGRDLTQYENLGVLQGIWMVKLTPNIRQRFFKHILNFIHEELNLTKK